jgi:hypothetical protein
VYARISLKVGAGCRGTKAGGEGVAGMTLEQLRGALSASSLAEIQKR